MHSYVTCNFLFACKSQTHTAELKKRMRVWKRCFNKLLNISYIDGITMASMCLDLRVMPLSPPVQYFTGRSKAVLLLCIIYVLFLLCFRARLFFDVSWSPAGKGLTS